MSFDARTRIAPRAVVDSTLNFVFPHVTKIDSEHKPEREVHSSSYSQPQVPVLANKSSWF